jgi:hypothetical protein
LTENSDFFPLSPAISPANMARFAMCFALNFLPTASSIFNIGFFLAGFVTHLARVVTHLARVCSEDHVQFKQ